MIISCFYNSKNRAIIVTSQNEVTTYKHEENVVYLLNGDQVVGMNIFDIDGYSDGVVVLKDEHKHLLTPFGDYEYGFVYGHILTCEPHPKSEKLQICQVDVQSQTLQIVCGAKNCQAGYLAVVAKPGAVMPSNLAIKPSKLIDIDSFGMLCSEKELGNINSELVGIILKDVDQELINMPFGG